MPELQSRLHAALAARYRIEGEIGAGGAQAIVARVSVCSAHE